MAYMQIEWLQNSILSFDLCSQSWFCFPKTTEKLFEVHKGSDLSYVSTLQWMQTAQTKDFVFAVHHKQEAIFV